MRGKNEGKLHLFDKFLGEMYILVAAVVLTPCQGLANIELSGMCMCALKNVIAEKTEFKEKHCHQLSRSCIQK